ncbi:MAG: hypothetical protein K0Q66_1537 [Chitinophagaceae bacterium]|jgi:hypothetical protein|nr:hypothetical protein [Chitinophagaceae bacterium]
MKRLFILLFSIAVLQSCNRKLAGTPACISKKIEEIKSQAKWNPPAEINEYEYNGKRVFLVSANCCDQYFMLLDGTCNSICAPSGGLTGGGDGKCTDFYKNAKHIRLVWKDPR